MKKCNKTNKKGFTMVEILIVVAIIAVLAVTIIPMISKYMKDAKDEFNKDVKKQMVVTGKNYYVEHSNLLPKNNSGKVYDWISLQKLATLKYTSKEFVDSNNESCMEKSYVVVYNRGLETNYYACMICGNKSYMTKEEESHCKVISNKESNPDTDPDANPDPAPSNNNKFPTCKIKPIDNAGLLKLIITGNDEDGYVEEMELQDVSTKKVIKNFVNENKGNSYTEEYTLQNIGNYQVAVFDNAGGKGICKVDMEVISNINFEYKQYFVSKDIYDKYKNKELPESEINNLQEYDGKDWKNGYVYLELKYTNSLFKNITINGENFLGKKFVWFADEGEKFSEIKTTTIKNRIKTQKVSRKLDRTPPTKVSGGSVSVGKTTAVEYKDDLSGVKSIRYIFSTSSSTPSISNSNWSNSTSGPTTVNTTYYVFSRGCDMVDNCSVNYLGNYKKNPPYPINDCKIRGDQIVYPKYKWVCTHGHTHTKAYVHYCSDSSGNLWTKDTNPSLVKYAWVCPTMPYGPKQGWTVVKGM